MTLFWHKIFLLIYSDKDLFHQHKIAAMMAWIKVYVFILPMDVIIHLCSAFNNTVINET